MLRKKMKACYRFDAQNYGRFLFAKIQVQLISATDKTENMWKDHKQ